MAQESELVFPRLEEKPSGLSVSGLFIVTGSALVVGLAIITALVTATKRSQLASLTRKNQEVDQALRLPELAAARAQLQGAAAAAARLRQVLEERTDWRALFETVNRATVKSVRVSAFSYDGKGILRIDGETGDFTSIAKQVAALRSVSVVKSVTVSSISPTSEKTTFSLNVELNVGKLKFAGGAQP